MNNLIIIGSGRWTRQIIQNLFYNNKVKNLNCFYKKKNSFFKNWLEKKNFNANVKLIKKIPLSKSKFSLAIICNATSDHFKFAKDMLKKKYNVYIEKPVTLKSQEARKLLQLSLKYNRKIFCSNIFNFSEGLKKIFSKIQKKKITKINFIWHDKFNEFRYGEKKKYDNKTPVYFDVLFHIFSLIDQIFLKDKYLISNIKKVKFLKNKSLIYFDINKIRISIDLNRRAKKRLRLIKLNEYKKNYKINFSSKNYILRTSKNSLNRDIKYFRDKRAPMHNMFKNIFMLIKKNKAKCRKTSITTILRHFYLIEKIIKK